jgi:ABC-type branched-subunit amino acid transport system substrate-binding protein
MVVLCALGLAAEACSSSKTKSAATNTTSASPTNSGSSNAAKGAPVKVGQILAIASPVLSLKGAATATKAAIDAYNNRGGLNGRPLQLDQCDDKNDPNLDVECARKMVSDGVVATLDDFTLGDPASVDKILGDAGIARIMLNPGTTELSSCTDICFPNGAGGTGITFAMGVVGVKKGGMKKLTLLYPDVPSAAQLPAAEKQVIAANGAEMVNAVPIGSSVTDYTQFVQAASKNSADGAILALGEAQATQVLSAAESLNSPLKFVASTGTFSINLLNQFPKVAKSLYMTDATPAPTASQADFPALKQFLADMTSSGDSNLKTNALRTQELGGWLAVFAFNQVMKGTDTGNISKESVLSAFKTAKDVDLGGLYKPAWTPATDNPLPFLKRAWPNYYVSHVNSGGNAIDTDPTPFNLVAAFAGK